MTTKTTAPMTDAQKSLTAAGRRLAKEMGLTHYSFGRSPKYDVEFTHGQAAMVITPDSITLGTIEVVEYDNSDRYRNVQYRLKDVFQFRKDYVRDTTAGNISEAEWVPSHFKPEVWLPPKGKLYVASAS